MRISIHTIERIPISSTEWAYRGTGTADGGKAQVTVALSQQGFNQARQLLLEGNPYPIDLHEEDVRAIAIA